MSTEPRPGRLRILAVSAHPDDELIGAGGTLLRHVDRGDEVYWVIFTKAYTPQWTERRIAIFKEEVYQIQQFMGFKQVYRLGFPTVKLNTVALVDLTSALQEVVNEVRPHVVYTTPRNDINQDHRIVHDATLVAVRPFPESPIRRTLSYEIGPTARYGLPSGGIAFHPTVFVDITPYLARKLEAMDIYQSATKAFPHPRSVEGLELLARERGLSVGLEAAECFELVREIDR